MYYCGECKKECEVHITDNGIGPVEYWGAKSVHHDYGLESDCCDEAVFENELCTVEADPGEYASEQECCRGDWEYDQRKDAMLEA